MDTAPGLGEHALAALDHTNDLVLMTSLDVPGVRGLRKELDIIRDLGLGFDGRHVLLNFSDSHSGLTKADVEATINTGVDLVLPRSRATATSVNQGVPLLQNDVRDPMTKQLRALVGRLAATPGVPGAAGTHTTVAPGGAPTAAGRSRRPGLRRNRDQPEPSEGGRHRFLRKRVQR